MKRVRFHPDAETEMLASAARYESQQEGLGRRFLDATRDAVNQLTINSALYRRVQGGVQRRLVKVFPYGVLFRDLPDEIVIIAVMHLHRDPDYWKTRV